jgi:maltooligosyltrehalose trehalohydrolase
LLTDGVVFNLWAPTADAVELIEEGKSPVLMLPEPDGWYQQLSRTAKAGTRYQFRIGGQLVVPDPASLFSPTMSAVRARSSIARRCVMRIFIPGGRGKTP